MLLTVAIVVLTTFTLTPTPVASATTTQSSAETTTPVTNAAICSMDAEGDSVTLEQGHTKSYLADQGVAYNMYTCYDTDTNNMTMTKVECGDNECIDPVTSTSVDGSYSCVACESIYDNATTCVDDANSAKQCADTDACYTNPEDMMASCCLSCKDNTPAESDPPSQRLSQRRRMWTLTIILSGKKK